MDFYDSVLRNLHIRPNYEFFDILSGIYIIYESAYVLLKKTTTNRNIRSLLKEALKCMLQNQQFPAKH